MTTLYLTRQRNGLYMLTARKPLLRHVGTTKDIDAYINPGTARGDPVGFRNMCPEITKQVFNLDQDLEVLETRRVRLEGKVVK